MKPDDLETTPWLIHGRISLPVGSTWTTQRISLDQARAIAQAGIRSGLDNEVDVQRFSRLLRVPLAVGEYPRHLQVGDVALVASLDMEAVENHGRRVSLEWIWSQAIMWTTVRRTG